MGIKSAKAKTDDSVIKLLAVAAGHFMNDFYMGIIPPLLVLFKESLSLTLTQQGFIAFIFTASGTWIQPFIGYMVDKYDRTWLLTVSVVWISLWISISGFISSYYLLVLVLILGGISSALYHPLGSAVAISLTKRRAGTSLSIFMTIGGFAIAVSAAAAVIPIKYGLGKLIFFIIPGLASALFMYIAGIHNIKLNLDIPKTGTNGERAGIKPSALLWVFILVTISAVRSWLRLSLPTYGAQLFATKSVSTEIFLGLLSIQLFTASFGNIVGGLMSDILGTKKVLFFAMILTSACLGITLQATGLIAMGAFIATGILISASNSANILLTRDQLPNNATLATGLIMGLGGGIGGLGVLFQGYIGDIYGIPFSFVYLLIAVAVSSLLAAAVPQISEQVRSPNC